jgi:ER lumen protein retaining receptor
MIEYVEYRVFYTTITLTYLVDDTTPPTMNIFRFLGDLSHLASIFILLHKIQTSRSCRGISFKTQALYLAVFCTRYLDLFTDYVSLYNSLMKLFFIGSTAYTLFLMKVQFR